MAAVEAGAHVDRSGRAPMIAAVSPRRSPHSAVAKAGPCPVIVGWQDQSLPTALASGQSPRETPPAGGGAICAGRWRPR